MKIDVGVNPNCSESVFRFYTLDPEKIHSILQALAEEINASADFGLPPGQKVPLYERAEDYEGTVLQACAGLGSNDCVVTIERGRGAFVLNIGNNDISGNHTGWIEHVKELGIHVEEAEFSPSLAKRYARDCTCGITYFKDYDGLIYELRPCECGSKMEFDSKTNKWVCTNKDCGKQEQATQEEIEALVSLKLR